MTTAEYKAAAKEFHSARVMMLEMREAHGMTWRGDKEFRCFLSFMAFMFSPLPTDIVDYTWHEDPRYPSCP